MTTFNKLLLSGSTNGRGIEVTQVGTPGDTIHTAVAGTASFDEVWLFAVNNGANSRILTIEFGGTTDPDDHIEITIPNTEGLFTIVPGLLIQNSCIVRAFADGAGDVTVFGYVNRITP